MQHIKEWLKSPEVLAMKKQTMGQNMTVDFFRDPMRNTLWDPELIYAPADGVVLYALPKVLPSDFLEIKGKEFTLQEMLSDKNYKDKSLVIGIFMTSFDVHVNRVPASAYYLESREKNQIYTHNISMMIAENELFSDFHYDRKALSYLFCNEREVSVFYCPNLGGRYYIVQVGDKDIDVIQNWGEGFHLFQGERFGSIRWGSQVDLIIPLKKKKFKILVKEMDHVQAGIDAIAQII